jgi:hypothetical protein
MVMFSSFSILYINQIIKEKKKRRKEEKKKEKKEKKRKEEIPIIGYHLWDLYVRHSICPLYN